MLKRIAFTVAISMIALYSFPQGFFQDSKKCINISTELGNYGVYLFPNFSVDYKKNTFAFGPILNIYDYFNFLKDDDKGFIPTNKRFFGFHFYYQYNFQPDKIFDFFVQTNLTYENKKSVEHSITSTNINLSWDSKRVNIIHTLGVGERINVSKCLFINICVDIGFYYMKTIKVSDGYSFLTEKQPNITGIIRTGIGYRF